MQTQSNVKTKWRFNYVFSARFAFFVSCVMVEPCVAGWRMPWSPFVLILVQKIMTVYTSSVPPKYQTSHGPSGTSVAPTWPGPLWSTWDAMVPFHVSSKILRFHSRLLSEVLDNSRDLQSLLTRLLWIVDRSCNDSSNLSTPLPKSQTSKPFCEPSQTVKTSLSLLKCFRFGFTESHWKCRKST